jgi:hypothetical protein
VHSVLNLHAIAVHRANLSIRTNVRRSAALQSNLSSWRSAVARAISTRIAGTAVGTAGPIRICVAWAVIVRSTRTIAIRIPRPVVVRSTLSIRIRIAWTVVVRSALSIRIRIAWTVVVRSALSIRIRIAWTVVVPSAGTVTIRTACIAVSRAVIT